MRAPRRVRNRRIPGERQTLPVRGVERRHRPIDEFRAVTRSRPHNNFRHLAHRHRASGMLLPGVAETPTIVATGQARAYGGRPALQPAILRSLRRVRAPSKLLSPMTRRRRLSLDGDDAVYL